MGDRYLRQIHRVCFGLQRERELSKMEVKANTMLLDRGVSNIGAFPIWALPFRFFPLLLPRV